MNPDIASWDLAQAKAQIIKLQQTVDTQADVIASLYARLTRAIEPPLVVTHDERLARRRAELDAYAKRLQL